MNFRIITKNHAADSKIRSPKKMDFRADEIHESHPTAWELKLFSIIIFILKICSFFQNFKGNQKFATSRNLLYAAQ